MSTITVKGRLQVKINGSYKDIIDCAETTSDTNRCKNWRSSLNNIDSCIKLTNDCYKNLYIVYPYSTYYNNYSSYYQTAFRIGKIGNKNRYISYAGTRPQIYRGKTIVGSNEAGKYTITKNGNGSKIVKPDGTSVNCAGHIIRLFVNGAGGGGHGGHYNVKYYIVWASQYIVDGFGGGGSGGFYGIIDLSRFDKLEVTLGRAGAGSTGDNSAENGGHTYIKLYKNGSPNICTLGGGSAGGCRVADISSIDWNFGFSTEDRSRGKDGAVLAFNSAVGLFGADYIASSANPISYYMSDRYCEDSGMYVDTFGVGGSYGGCPSKPGLNSTNTTSGGNGGPAQIVIIY